MDTGTRTLIISVLVISISLLSGCEEIFIKDADQEVSTLVRSRQMEALGQTSNADIGNEPGRIARSDTMYDFSPHPVDSRVPDIFHRIPENTPDLSIPEARPLPINETNQDLEGDVPTLKEMAQAEQPADTNGIAHEKEQPEQSTDQEETESDPLDLVRDAIGTDSEFGDPFTLQEALAYAFRHSREFQYAKEDLYLSALALSLERFLWTPQLSAELTSQYANYGEIRDFDHAMDAVATVAAEQRLPLGGTITAQVVGDWVRDIGESVTVGETGTAILRADIPLLKGAGKVAYESRYQAERDLIYAVRTFERYRREFLVDIANDYFSLLVQKAQIKNARASVKNFRSDMERARELARSGRGLRVDADRAEVELLNAQNSVAVSLSSYENALDQFKIRIGMPIEQRIDAVRDSVELYDPEVPEKTAIDSALKYRLDLLNTTDALDDSRRGIEIAKNNILPKLDWWGSVQYDTDPARKNMTSYNQERTTWRTGLALEIPLQRLPERNEFRSALIDYRRSERTLDQREDEVRRQVRQSLRTLELARISIEIQRRNIEINRFRSELARTQFEMGELSNRDIVEAENDLRSAQDNFAQAVASYYTAILSFYLETGTLRVDDEGRWLQNESVASASQTTTQ